MRRRDLGRAGAGPSVGWVNDPPTASVGFSIRLQRTELLPAWHCRGARLRRSGRRDWDVEALQFRVDHLGELLEWFGPV